MRRPATIALALLLAAAPAAAQEAEPPSLMERGLRLLMEGLAEEMEPALRDLEGLAREAQPLMEQLRESLGDAFAGLDAYHPPEVLPNGDILIRRREAAPDAAPEGDRLPRPGAPSEELEGAPPDGSIEL